MARIRSPGYPNVSLEQVIENVGKVHQQDRQHPVDRSAVALHLGFSGLSGAADRALSALLHYGLMEKVKKGELRVTDLALRILHPCDPSERREALYEAGFAPELFTELRQRYPEAPPSRDSLSSYLSRSGFASAAIPAATKAYLETCYFLQREHAYDLGVAPPEPVTDSVPVEPQSEPNMTPSSPAATAHQSGTRTIMSNRTLTLNEPYLDIRGSREVHIEGLLDYDGLIELEEKLKALKMLITKKPAPSSSGQGDNDKSE